MDGFPELTIGEVARRAGVATSSIRYYERIGLLPKPDRAGGQRRYDADVLGTLGFIGVAQSAGFKLREIKELIDGADGLGAPMRSLSGQKLGEVEALLERTKAMKGWLEVAQECGCATPAECALFPAPGEEHPGTDLALRVIRVRGKTVAGRPRAESPRCRMRSMRES
jgi:MerR family redox-sensitive transcriptional activator SoxR